MYEKLTIHELPHICFAHAYATSSYDLSFSERRNFMELTFYEQGDVIRQAPGVPDRLIPEQTFSMQIFDAPFRLYSQASACRHMTVGFEAAYERTAVTRKEVLTGGKSEQSDCLSLFLPEIFLRTSDAVKMEGLLRRIIALHHLPDAAQQLRCTALLFELLATLNEETIRAALLEEGSLSPSALLYAQRAVRYIAAHLQEKISVRTLAEQLGVSAGYLSGLFKAYTGSSVTGYINAIRVERIKELICDQRLGLREAGESVGLTDENYASRLFRQYTGQSVREFLRERR